MNENPYKWFTRTWPRTWKREYELKLAETELGKTKRIFRETMTELDKQWAPFWNPRQVSLKEFEKIYFKIQKKKPLFDL